MHQTPVYAYSNVSYYNCTRVFAVFEIFVALLQLVSKIMSLAQKSRIEMWLFLAMILRFFCHKAIKSAFYEILRLAIKFKLLIMCKRCFIQNLRYLTKLESQKLKLGFVGNERLSFGNRMTSCISDFRPRMTIRILAIFLSQWFLLRIPTA